MIESAYQAYRRSRFGLSNDLPYDRRYRKANILGSPFFLFFSSQYDGKRSRPQDSSKERRSAGDNCRTTEWVNFARYTPVSQTTTPTLHRRSSLHAMLRPRAVT